MRNSIFPRVGELFGCFGSVLFAFSDCVRYNRCKSIGGTSMKALTYMQQGKLALSDIEEAYRIFENKLDGVIKVAVCPTET